MNIILYVFNFSLSLFFFFFLTFCLFRATSAAYGGPQARGRIGAVAAGLRQIRAMCATYTTSLSAAFYCYLDASFCNSCLILSNAPFLSSEAGKFASSSFFLLRLSYFNFLYVQPSWHPKKNSTWS